MSTSSPDVPLPAEEYELSSPPAAGPSTLPPRQHPSSSTTTTRPRRTSSNPKAPPASRRTLTLHPNTTTNSLLFSAPTSSLPAQQHRRTPSSPVTPRRHPSHFLREDLELDQLDNDVETVHFPDFSHMLGLDQMGGEDHFQVASGMRTRWKRKLYLLMEEPSSGREAFFVHVLVTGGILFSAILTTLSTLPSYHTDPTSIRVLFGLDTTIVLLFTIEYLARSLAHSDSLSQYTSWATSFFALLDLIAILPYYIEVARNDDTSILFRFSILRTFRLLRVFRAFKYQNQMLLTIEVMYVAVQRSKDALVALSFFILLVLVFFSTLIYFAERGSWDPNLGLFVDVDGDPSLFDSIPQTAWFALVTMSTVGFGDVVPRSMLGKLLTVPLLMFGLLLIALPSFVLGRNFAIVFDAMTRQAHKPVSALTSPRASLDRPEPHRPLSPPSLSNQTTEPLLPISTSDPLSLSTSNLSKRANSPLPLPATSGVGMTPSQSASSSRPPLSIQQPPRMWDNDPLGGTTATAAASDMRKGDLTNVKLAKNQVVLLEQIEGLRRMVERQNEILGMLGGAMGVGLDGGVIRRRTAGEYREEAGQGGAEGANGYRGAGKEEEQFTLGVSDEER